MASILGGSVGPMGSNISDYTNLPNTLGIGPVASGQQYAQMLNPQSSFLSGLQGAGDAYKNVTKNLQQQKPMEMMQLAPMRQTGPLQQVDLLSLLRGMGGY